MAEETKKKVRSCPQCERAVQEVQGKRCPVCGEELLTRCPACHAVLEDNGDATECRQCGLTFED